MRPIHEVFTDLFSGWSPLRRIIPAVLLAASAAVAPGTARAQDTVRITLEEAIEIASSRSVDLVRAHNALRSARTRIETARGAFQPTLSLSAGPSVRYQLGTSEGIDGESNNASGSLSLGASSGYTIYNGNADRAALLQAEQLARASDVGIDRTAQTTLFTLIGSFYDVATQRELMGVERENLNAERLQLERINAFVEAGTRPVSDRYAQEATVAAAELRMLQAEQRMETAKLALVDILLLDPLGRYDFPPPGPAAETGPSPGEGPTALVEQALTNRPEIVAQQARIEAAEQGIRIADAGDAPSLSLSLSGSLGTSYSTVNDREGFGSQLFTNNPSASLGLSLSLPVFDRNRTDAAVEQAQIEYENELLTMAALRQQVSIEIRQALLDLNNARGQLDAAQRQVAATAQGLEVEQARYQSGVSTFVELAQARARHVAAQAQVVQARNAVELQTRALAYVVGLFRAPRGTPQPPQR